MATADKTLIDTISAEATYGRYLQRQEREIETFRKEEAKFIDTDLDYNSIKGLSNEHKQKLNIVRPSTIGQAQRIDGITPAAIGLILSHLNKTEAKTEI